MKTRLLLLTMMLFTITLSYSQGTGEVIITEIHNRPQKPSPAQMVFDALASQPAYWTDNGSNVGNQVDNDQGDEGHAEWFEVYNTTASPVVMDNWTLTDASSSSNVTTISSFTIQSGEYAIFTGYHIPEAHGLLSTDTFGDYIYDYKKPSFNNESSYADADDKACPDGIIIKKADGTLVDEVRYDYGYGEYIGNPESSASCSGNAAPIGFPVPVTGSPSRISFQLDNNYLNATDNDNPLYWTFTDDSVAANEYDTTNSQFGTPGTANSSNPTLSNVDFSLADFSIYPNPANSILNFQTGNLFEISSVEIFDLLGKRIMKSELQNNRLNVSELSKGMYLFIADTNSGKQITKKVIIN